MKDSRTKNSSRNIIYGMVNRIINIFFPFLIRSAIIYALGIQFVGINSLFTSILGVLNLAELGIGNALTYSMYEPAEKGDIKLLSALLNFYKKCYKVIGGVVFGIGLMLIPFLTKLIKGDYPTTINLYLLYSIYLFNTVISYLLFAYKGAVLIAFQRNDIRSNIASIIQIIQYLFQLGILIVFKNYYLYIIIMPIMTIATNLLISYKVDQCFDHIKCEGDISIEKKREIAIKVKGMFYQKFGVVVLRSVDSIVISAFLGLSLLAVYNNYYMIITALFGFFSIIMESLIPSVGNAIITKSVDENYKDFKKFNFMYYILVTWASAFLISLYQPFMMLWVGKKYLLNNSIMILFVVYFFIHKWMDMGMVYLEAGGIWWENRFVPLVAALLNLVLNIILVNIIGLYGILVSTIASILLVYNTGCIHVLFKFYFKKSTKEYVFDAIKYIVNAGITITITFAICEKIVIENNLITLFVRFGICMFIPVVMMFVAWRKKEEMKSTVEMMGRFIGEKGKR